MPSKNERADTVLCKGIDFEKKIKIIPVNKGNKTGKNTRLFISFRTSQQIHIVRSKFLIGSVC